MPRTTIKMNPDNFDAEDLIQDPTYTDAGQLKGGMELTEVYDTALRVKQIQNSYHLKKASESRCYELSKALEDEIRNIPNAIRISARNERGFTDLLRNAIRHVRENQCDMDGYKWFINVETMDMVRHLYDDYFDRMMQTTEINPDRYSLKGIDFMVSKDIEPGEILLADEEFIQTPIRSHPFVLIEGVDDGYPTGIDLNVGGEIELYTIQK